MRLDQLTPDMRRALARKELRRRGLAAKVMPDDWGVVLPFATLSALQELEAAMVSKGSEVSTPEVEDSVRALLEGARSNMLASLAHPHAGATGPSAAHADDLGPGTTGERAARWARRMDEQKEFHHRSSLGQAPAEALAAVDRLITQTPIAATRG